MDSKIVDRDLLEFPTGEFSLSEESLAVVADDAFIFVAQAFCPNGHDLVAFPGPLFHGFPGLSLQIVGEGVDDVLTLSPMHGDEAKEGAEAVVAGRRYELRCPLCREELTAIGPCDCGEGQLHAMDLVAGGEGEIAAICDVAGCRRSRLMDGLEVIAVFQG